MYLKVLCSYLKFLYGTKGDPTTPDKGEAREGTLTSHTEVTEMPVSLRIRRDGNTCKGHPPPQIHSV